jgi:hypothetical protein
MVTAMNPTSIIKKPEIFSNLSQEVKKVLYPVGQRGKGQTYNGAIECDTQYHNAPPPNPISHSNTMGKEVTIKQNLGEQLQSESISNQTNEESTFYSSQSQYVSQKEMEQLKIGVHITTNPHFITQTGIHDVILIKE